MDGKANGNLVDWQIFLQVTLPIAAGFGWMIVRMDKRFDKVNERLNNLDLRLYRLESKFKEQGYWESRHYYETKEH